MTQRILSEIQKHDRRLLSLERQAANTPVRNGRGGGGPHDQAVYPGTKMPIECFFKVLSVGSASTYLNCEPISNNYTSGIEIDGFLLTEIKVAFPPALSARFDDTLTFLDGDTVTFASKTANSRVTATVGGISQEQVITPYYYVNEIILGRYIDFAGYSGLGIYYMDMNLAGRSWAQDFADA